MDNELHTNALELTVTPVAEKGVISQGEKEHAPPPIKMAAKFNETEFPRKDNYFRSKNSLSF
jgi:hypothetical protein